MKRGTDLIIVKYDESKSDEADDKFTNKNIYANPTAFSLCFFTALGICCFYESVLLMSREDIFLTENSKLGIAGHRFCDCLKIIQK